MGFTTEPVDKSDFVKGLALLIVCLFSKASELFDESKAQSSGTSDDKTILKVSFILHYYVLTFC
jgi:hypothetical protein